MPEKFLENAARLLSKARRVVILTGAGISAESGIAPFRGSGGIWSRYDPMEYATAEAFARDPGKVWRMLRELGDQIARALPNEGHRALARLEASGRFAVDVVTQNVDGLHQRAGSQSVIELHGSGRELRCASCDGRTAADALPADVALPPRCACGGILRPDVVLFGEMLPPGAFDVARRLTQAADLFMIVGTSAEVAPAASLPALARDHGARLIEINPEVTWLSERADVVLRGAAGDILPKLLAMEMGDRK